MRPGVPYLPLSRSLVCLTALRTPYSHSHTRRRNEEGEEGAEGEGEGEEGEGEQGELEGAG